MPELPEVETVRRGLLDQVTGRTIADIRVGLFAGVVGPLGVESTRARLLGRRITGILRRGKYLFFTLDDETYLMVHLRMTGVLQVLTASDPPLRFEHLALKLDDGATLRFADQRKFGRVLHLMPDEFDMVERAIGPEPLEPGFTPGLLAQRLSGRTAKLKSTLLDQRRLAGLGNIYVDEALFRAGLHPERPAGSLQPADVERLHAAIQAVLNEALARRGTTFSTFADSYGDAGNNQENLRVYGRGRRGVSCVHCGNPLELLIIGGRSTHFCPVCQPRWSPSQ
ncbi:MAG: bifunctional DNA-formamidopyrimidine glycosylase/DNA-(apurinic or apyrimidinic site) lyase [Propionibacteriaceae bacterium]|nr:bifunctional DNA-formamidopyrimidine glycosylase/DNA-(apurinic or apyrimidinic site) lyase [Propionibacteriaceae bacterium]